MTAHRLTLAALLACAAACSQNLVHYDRELQRSYVVEPGSVVLVNLDGGSITTATGPAGVVQMTLRQAVDAGSDLEARETVADYEIYAMQEGDQVTLNARRKPGSGRDRGWRRGMHFEAVLQVPADVVLDLRTSGGEVTAGGFRTAALRANTSGGPLTVDGGAGALHLETSGGPVHVARALGAIEAATSGGDITIGLIGPRSRRVDLNTSGGSIHAEVSRDARFALTAETSGGRVQVEDLEFQSTANLDQDSHVEGQVNGGGPTWRAYTSGGSVVFRGTTDTGDPGASSSPRTAGGKGADVRISLP